jgi:predicted nicotinamide N-methyase
MMPDPTRDPGWVQLKSKIERSLSLVPTPIILGNQPLTWYRVENPEGLLEAAVQSDLPPEEVDPFWAAPWRAALGLDRFLDRINCTDVRILELGCGSGQAGVAAAIRGGRVLMTDVVPMALEVARLNAWPFLDRIQLKKLHWKMPDLEEDEPFPLIIGSDLVYDPNLFPQLESCARCCLEPGGRMLLSEPHRHTGDTFAHWIVQAGWKSIQHDVDLADQRVPIRIFECWLG